MPAIPVRHACHVVRIAVSVQASRARRTGTAIDLTVSI
jgi:hypothetical protein